MILLRNTSRLFRVLLLVLVGVAASTFGVAHLAIAKAETALLDVGRHLSVLGETAGVDGRTLVLNGQPLGFRVVTTDAPVVTVLDHFESWCRGGAGAFSGELDAVPWIEESPASDGSWRDLTVREHDGERGFVACLKTGPRRSTLSELRQRFERFAQSGNLVDVGRFHYAYVEPGQRRTRVIAVWTAGDFYPGDLFPEVGDAPGGDVDGVPRPPTGRRLFSAGELGHPYELTAYLEIAESVPELLAFYRQRLPDGGWRIAADMPVEGGGHSLVIERGDRLLVVVLDRDDEGQSTVTIASANGGTP